jgi:hypothetical protein
VTEENVWTLLLEGHDDVVELAESTVFAAIGADNNPNVLTEQLGKCADYVFAGPDEEIGRRAVRLAAAFTGISRGLTDVYGGLMAEIDEEGDKEAGPDVRRDAEVRMLHVALGSLRETIAGDCRAQVRTSCAPVAHQSEAVSSGLRR